MLLVDWYYNVKPSTQIKHCCLFQTGQSTTWWWKKYSCYGYIPKRVGSISPPDFDLQLSEVLVTFCLCPTFSVNDLGLFIFCCMWGAGSVALAGLLSLKGASHHLTW